MLIAGTVPRLLLLACGMRLVDAAHHSEVMIQCTIALCGFLDLEGRLAGWWFKCRAGTCTGGVGMLACLYRASWCSLPAMMNNTACYCYMLHDYYNMQHSYALQFFL